MIFLQKNGAMIVEPVDQNFMHQQKSTWKETSGFIHIPIIVLVVGNE